MKAERLFGLVLFYIIKSEYFDPNDYAVLFYSNSHESLKMFKSEAIYLRDLISDSEFHSFLPHENLKNLIYEISNRLFEWKVSWTTKKGASKRHDSFV